MLSSEPSDPRFSPLFSALSAFCSLVLDGLVPEVVQPFFFGARLIALSKDNGGVCPMRWVVVSSDWLQKLLCNVCHVNCLPFSLLVNWVLELGVG